MLARARRRVRRATFRRASAFAVPLPPCVGVLAAGECLNYRVDREPTSAALARLFRRVEAALTPGGVLLFDVAGPGRGGPTGTTRSWREGPGWAVLSEAREDGRRRTLTRRIVSFRRSGAGYRRGEETHVLRLFATEDVRAALGRAGFRARRLSRREGWTSVPGGTAFFGLKPPDRRGPSRPR